MPRRNGRGFGDLYITFEVDFPVELTEDQKKKIAEVLGRPEPTGSSSSSDEDGKGSEL